MLPRWCAVLRSADGLTSFCLCVRLQLMWMPPIIRFYRSVHFVGHWIFVVGLLAMFALRPPSRRGPGGDLDHKPKGT